MLISQYFGIVLTLQIYQAPTALARKYLYFNVLTHNNNQTLTVEGGGVNATVTLPNIAATNGFVHIIDRVLGVPYTTILEKLKTDPMLKWEIFKICWIVVDLMRWRD